MQFRKNNSAFSVPGEAREEMGVDGRIAEPRTPKISVRSLRTEDSSEKGAELLTG